jgi:hypothetical protein
VIAVAATLLVNVPGIAHPLLLIDDFQILVGSWTWHDAWSNLWLPQNEHSMPLGRLSTWLLAQLARKPTHLPLVLALQGPLAVVAAALLAYLLVRRETGRRLPALLAMLLLGVNTHYQNAVNWFSASFAVLALDTLLLGVLAAQRWRQTGRYGALALSALWCALAPGWFATGVLAGPLCTLYLLAPPSAPAGAAPAGPWWRRLAPSGAGWRAALVPCLGTLVSLAVTLPLNGRRILSLPRVEVEATAWQTFDPWVGLGYTLRAMVDDLVPGAAGFGELTSPIWVVAAVWVLFAAAGVWLWLRAAHRPLLLFGLGLIVGGYWLVYSGRAYFDYKGMHHWGRYQLLPHLGLVLVVCAGLPRRFIDWLGAAPHWALDLGAVCLLGLLLLTQWPRAGAIGYEPQQHADLERVEKVDARCREQHIDAATAREALPEFEVYGMFGREISGHRLSGWDLLRGSDDPQPMTVEEARRLLDEK